MPDGPGIPDGEAELGDRTRGRELRAGRRAGATGVHYNASVARYLAPRYLLYGKTVTSTDKKNQHPVSRLVSPDCRGALRSPAGRGREAGERDPWRCACGALPARLAVAARMRGWYTARVCGLSLLPPLPRRGRGRGGAPCSIHCGIHALLGLRSGPVTGPAQYRVPSWVPTHRPQHVPTCGAH